MERRLPAGIPKIILCDGGKNIWGYINDNPLYEEYEQLVDYYHFTGTYSSNSVYCDT